MSRTCSRRDLLHSPVRRYARAISRRPSRSVQVSATLLLGRKAAEQPVLETVRSFVRSWQRGDIAKLRQFLAVDCLVLEPLWGNPGSQPVLCGVDEVARFRQSHCQSRHFSNFNIIDVASVSDKEGDRVYLYFRETCIRKPLVWDYVERALRTQLLFPIFQSDEAGVIMFKLNKAGQIKEVVCIRKPPQVDEFSCRVAEDEYLVGPAETPQYLELFDSM